MKKSVKNRNLALFYLFLRKNLHMCDFCCTFEGTDTAAPSHLEATFALSCKLQTFQQKIRLYKHRRYFFAKKFANLKNLLYLCGRKGVSL